MGFFSYTAISHNDAVPSRPWTIGRGSFPLCIQYEEFRAAILKGITFKEVKKNVISYVFTDVSAGGTAFVGIHFNEARSSGWNVSKNICHNVRPFFSFLNVT